MNDTVSLVVGEPAANAVTHGLVPGRDVLLRLVRAEGGRLWVEVGDTRGERLPASPTGLPADAETGRGLVLVAALAEERGVTPREDAPGKTVWAALGAGDRSAPPSTRLGWSGLKYGEQERERHPPGCWPLYRHG